jgi:hypothetical protein
MDSREDYFHMASKRRKDPNLPPNFCSAHYREMEFFLSQRLCLNPPRQRDSFTNEDNNVPSTEELAMFCAAENLTAEMLSEEGFADPVLQHNISLHRIGENLDPRLPRKPGVANTCTTKGKDKLENAAKNMSVDPRPMNTTVRRRQSSSQTKMVEVTET